MNDTKATVIEVDEMIVDRAFELQALKILYEGKEPLYFRQQRERILAQLETLHILKRGGARFVDRDLFVTEANEDDLIEHVESEIQDEQKAEVMDEIREELALHYADQNDDLSEDETKELVDSWDDEEVLERYEEIN